MKDVSSGAGRTVLFVSHNLTAIQSLCSKAILLSNGQVEKRGEVATVIAHYQNKHNSDLSYNELNTAIHEGIVLEKIALHSVERETDMLTRNDDIGIVTTLSVIRELEFYVGLILRAGNGEVVFETASKLALFEKGNYKVECKIPARLLNSNLYTIQINIIARGPKLLHYAEDVLRFEIFETEAANDFYGKVLGVIRPDLEWMIAKI